MSAARGRYEPVAVTCAVTGGDTLPSQNENIPCGAEAIVAAAVGAARAGASAVHLHARDDEGRPSGSPELFAEIAAGIRKQCDAVINVSTGGAPGMSVEERLSGAAAVRPELTTFNLGTMNYEGYPVRGRWPKVNRDWEREVLENSGDIVFVNTLNTLREFAAAAREIGSTPELEAYDASHLAMARFLLDEGVLEGPVRVQMVLGVLGGTPNTLSDLFEMKNAAERILGEDLGALGVAAVGYPMQFRHAATALGFGMDCRVGLEDSVRISRKEMAPSNGAMVEVVRGLADTLGRPVMKPDELRRSLGPWWKGVE